MINRDPAAPARPYAGRRPANASFYARVDAMRERRAPPYRPQWMREEERQAEEVREAKAHIAHDLSSNDRLELARIRSDIAWTRFELAMPALLRKGGGYDPSTALRPDFRLARMIDGPENVVSIPRLKHWELNGWMETKSDAFGGFSPREYLRGRSWNERYEVGLRGLREVGVLKP